MGTYIQIAIDPERDNVLLSTLALLQASALFGFGWTKLIYLEKQKVYIFLTCFQFISISFPI